MGAALRAQEVLLSLSDEGAERTGRAVDVGRDPPPGRRRDDKDAEGGNNGERGRELGA